jgi:nucleolar protein 53
MEAVDVRRQLQVERSERAGAQPPRMGRRRFKAEPLQVLLSEEADRGSLRQLKPAAALARDRFKTFLRKGLVEP